MPPFSPADDDVKVEKMGLKVNLNLNNNDGSSDSHDVPFKPLIQQQELSSVSSFPSLALASASSTCFSSSLPSPSSFASSRVKQQAKMKRSVSFRENPDEVFTVDPLNHPRDIQDRWYSKRELHIIKHKIRSLLRWYNMTNEHYFQYEHDNESQELNTRKVPPPPQPPCATYYEECLFGLEKHLFMEKELVRETKYQAQTVVFSEQRLQKQMGRFDQDRLANSYALTSAASQQEALMIAQINAQESELHRQELEAQQRFEQEQQRAVQQAQQERELELQRIESLETSFLSQEDSDLEHLFLREGRPPRNPFDFFRNWRACFGKLFRPQECEIDSDEDCLNAPPRQLERHPCLNVQYED